MHTSGKHLTIVTLLSIGITLGGLGESCVLAQTAKDVESAGKGSQKFLEGLSSFVSGQEEAAKFESLLEATTGKNTKTMLGLSKSLKSLGKMSSVISGMGVGLGMGMAFADALGLFGPSAEEQTMEALREITRKIDTLQDVMLDRFDQLESKVLTKIELESAKTQIRGHLTRLSTVQKEVELYADLVRDPKPDYARIDVQEKALTTGISPSQILEAVNGVYEQMVGENLATSLTEANYRSSFGDMSYIAEVSIKLSKMVRNGQFAYEMITMMKERRGNEDDLAKQFPREEDRVKFKGPLTYERAIAISATSQAKFGPLLEGIGTMLETYAIRGVKEREANVMAYMKDKYGGEPHTDRTRVFHWLDWDNLGEESKLGFKKVLDKPEANFNSFAKKYGTLAQELKKRYLCDWLVVAYHPRHSAFHYSYGFNWYGSNAIWFLENESKENFISQDPMRTFLLLKWTDLPAPEKPPANLIRTLDQLDKSKYPKAITIDRGFNFVHVLDEEGMDAYSNTPLELVKVLASSLGTFKVRNEAGEHEESGLVLSVGGWYRESILNHYPPCPKHKNFRRADGSGGLTIDEGLPPGPQVKQSGNPIGYGALYVDTTNFTRLTSRSSKHRLLLYYR